MKKNLAFLVALCLCLHMTTMASAASYTHTGITSNKNSLLSTHDLTSELADAKLGIVDQNIDANILNAISVSASENKDTTYTVQDLGKVKNGNSIVGNMYSLTSATKTESGNATKYGVYAWLNVIWIDYFGTDNELVEVNGGWEKNGQVLVEKFVKARVYTVFDESIGFTGYPEEDTFCYTDLGMTGLSIDVNSYAEVDGYNYYVTVSVSPSILD